MDLNQFILDFGIVSTAVSIFSLFRNTGKNWSLMRWIGFFYMLGIYVFIGYVVGGFVGVVIGDIVTQSRDYSLVSPYIHITALIGAGAAIVYKARESDNQVT